MLLYGTVHSPSNIQCSYTERYTTRYFTFLFNAPISLQSGNYKARLTFNALISHRNGNYKARLTFNVPISLRNGNYKTSFTFSSLYQKSQKLINSKIQKHWNDMKILKLFSFYPSWTTFHLILISTRYVDNLRVRSHFFKITQKFN